jgi:hypothetical protein
MKQIQVILFLAVAVAIVFVCLAYTSSAKGLQWGNNFKYANLTEMKEDGWTLTRESGISLPPGGGVILNGAGGVCAIGHYSDVPAGIFDWKVEVQGIWLGGSGHSLVDAKVLTERHSYFWAADGSTGEYVFFRDGAKIPATPTEIFGIPEYQERANEVLQLDMERHGPTIMMYVNSVLKRTYLETDTQLSRVTGVEIDSPSGSAVKYIYGGGYVPEPDPSGLVDANPAPISEPNPQLPNNPTDPIPQPPPPTLSPDEPSNGDYPSGPVADENPPQSPSSTITIVVNAGSFSINTDPAKPNDAGQALAAGHILPNVNSVGIYTPESMQACANEQNLADSGVLAPGTHSDFIPFGGNPVNYYVTINAHVSGDLYNPDPNVVGSSVAVITAQVTDASGNVVYQHTVTATASQGYSIVDLNEQAVNGVNQFFQNVIGQNR